VASAAAPVLTEPRPAGAARPPARRPPARRGVAARRGLRAVRHGPRCRRQSSTQPVTLRFGPRQHGTPGSGPQQRQHQEPIR